MGPGGFFDQGGVCLRCVCVPKVIEIGGGQGAGCPCFVERGKVIPQPFEQLRCPGKKSLSRFELAVYVDVVKAQLCSGKQFPLPVVSGCKEGPGDIQIMDCRGRLQFNGEEAEKNESQHRVSMTGGGTCFKIRWMQ